MSGLVPERDCGGRTEAVPGAALMALRRWDDALANEDMGLKVEKLEDSAKARLLRGRDYSLTELGRLEEAQAAYRESLKVEPGSALANNEIAYIEGLLAGKPKAPAGGLNSVQKTPGDQPPAQP